jgi:hypothetical protein
MQHQRLGHVTGAPMSGLHFFAGHFGQPVGIDVIESDLVSETAGVLNQPGGYIRWHGLPLFVEMDVPLRHTNPCPEGLLCDAEPRSNGCN